MEAIVVSADSRRDLEGLVANEPLRRSFSRILVVDNACTDGSGDVARAAGLDVLRLDRRVGYGEAVNRAVREVHGDFFAVLNPDIRFFADDTLSRLRHHFMHPQVAIVAPGLELLDGSMQDSARRIPTPMNLLFRRWLGRERGWIRRGGDVEWTVGACWLVRRAAWEQVGGLDEDYFLYFEDVEIGHRLRRAGWTVRYDPTVVVQHAFQGASRRSLTSPAGRYHLRSALLFFRRHPRYLVDPRPADIGPPERRRSYRLPERRRVPR